MIKFKNDPLAELLAVLNKLYPETNIEIYYDPRMNAENNELVVLSDNHDIIFVNPNLDIMDIFQLILYNVAYIVIGAEDPEDSGIDDEAKRIQSIYHSMTHFPSNNLLH